MVSLSNLMVRTICVKMASVRPSARDPARCERAGEGRPTYLRILSRCGGVGWSVRVPIDDLLTLTCESPVLPPLQALPEP